MPIDHTPMTPATDDRPIRILERTPVPDAHKARLFALVRLGQEEALRLGADLQAEFGRDHVALIAEHNQFIRLFRGGIEPGAVELWLDEPAKEALRAAGFTVRDPEGAVFKLFGWARLDPMAGPEEALQDAVKAALEKARASKKKSHGTS